MASELKRVETLLLDIEKHLVVYQMKTKNDEESQSLFIKWQEYEHEYWIPLCLLMPKITARMALVDVITKQPRYGPKMITKIQDMILRYETCQVDINNIRILREKEYEGSCTRQHDKKRIDVHAAEMEEQEMERKDHIEKQNQREVDALIKLNEEERLKELSTRADLVRNERSQGREMYINQRKAFMSKQVMLNEDIKTRDKMGIYDAMKIVQRNTNDVQFRDAYQTVQLFITNIIQFPENEMYRQLKSNNTFYWNSIGQYPGGHQCLYAIGFDLSFLTDDIESMDVFFEMKVNGEKGLSFSNSFFFDDDRNLI